MAKKTEPPKGRVLTGDNQNVFKAEDGGRHNYGVLAMTALTGLTREELAKEAESHLDPKQAAKFRKELATGGDISATLLDQEDQFFHDYIRISAGPSLLAPPIAPERLERLVSENNTLEPCIAAMITNISGTGYKILPKDSNNIDLSDEEKIIQENIEEFLAEVFPRKSFMKTRKELRRDLHHTGNSYKVFEHTMTGDLAFLRRAPSKSMRLVKLDAAVPVTVKVMRGGKEVELKTMRAERRFVQKIGTKLIYYKEYGASRDLDRVTGEWAKEGEKLPAARRAHSIVHDKDIEDVRSPYGMPRWITQLPSVLGSRMAEEHNLAFFHSGGVPPVIVFISGGIVSEEVAKTLNSYLGGQSSKKQRGVAVEVPASGNLDSEKAATVKVEKFGANDADSTFEKYDERNELRIRRSFRMPSIFLGASDSYNFATAHASYVVAEAQVFAPERTEEDERYNMSFMREIDPKGIFKFVSNPLTVNDVNLQLRALSMLQRTEGISLSEWVDQLATIASLDIKVAEEFKETLITPQAEAPAGEGTGQGITPRPPINEGEQGAAGATQKAIKVLASKMQRCIRDYEDNPSEACLTQLLTLEKEFDEMVPDDQDGVEQILSRLMYTSPFLVEAASNEVSAGYAKAAFNDAKRRTEMKDYSL